MKDKIPKNCPGCSRHCPANALRCKKGRAWIAQAACPPELRAASALRPVRKWEKHIPRGGLAWRLVFTGRKAKKALNGRRLTEEQIFARLSPSERQTLNALLEKVDFAAAE